jgi:hypothetical protein
MVPTRSVVIPTTAGRSVAFRNGVATVYDTNDLPYLLARPDVRITLTSYALGWMDDVLAHTPKVNADLHYPVEPTVVEEAPADEVEAVLKIKKPWRKPPSN